MLRDCFKNIYNNHFIHDVQPSDQTTLEDWKAQHYTTFKITYNIHLASYVYTVLTTTITSYTEMHSILSVDIIYCIFSAITYMLYNLL